MSKEGTTDFLAEEDVFSCLKGWSTHVLAKGSRAP